MFATLVLAPVLTMAAAATPAVSTGLQRTGADRDIVVTARRLEDTARDLAACVARRCAPREDMAATLAHAENQFIAGDYLAARRTLAGGIGRNKRFAADYPEPVAGLMRASGRISMHEGDVDKYRLQTLDMADVLRDHLPAEDPRVFGARMEVADAFARAFRYDLAHRRYAEIAREADAAGLKKLQGMALLRIANIRVAQAIADPAGWRSVADRSVKVLTENADPGLAPFAGAARVLGARLAERAGDKGAIDRLIARYAVEHRETRPVLLSAPAIDLEAVGLRRPPRATGTLDLVTAISTLPASRIAMTTDALPEWADVAFWIGEDGKVGDVQLLRTSDNFAGRWDTAVVRGIGERRYAPLALPAGEAGLFRVERYTFRYDHVAATGSRIPTRSRDAGRLEVTDLTVEPQQVAAR